MENELKHYGVKGMHWGVRKDDDKPSRKTARMAKKDAKEFARAKMYYGEGAGNRRKLIKATVEERSKDPHYKSEFEKHLANQDMSKHASAAKKERSVNTAKAKTAKTARGLYHLSVGDMASVSASAAAIYGIAHMTGADRVVAKHGKKYAYEAYNYVKGQIMFQQMFRNTRR